MNLSTKERRVLAAAQFRADLPISAIASVCGYREHTVRNAIQNLKASGIITKRSMVDVKRLGLTRFALFFSLARENRQLKDALFSALIDNERVGWIRELGGEFPYVFDVIAPTIDEVWFIIAEISRRFGNVFFEKSLAVRYGLLYFERAYLSPDIPPTPPLEEMPLSAASQQVKIDEVDHRILSLFGHTPDAPDIRLARLLGIPRSTLQSRLRQLRDSGVLLRSFYDLNPRLAGVFAYRLLIRTRGVTPESTLSMRTYMERHPRYVSLIMCMGAWDYETTIEVEDQRDATRLVTELYEHFGETMSEIKLLPVFEEPKDIMYPFKNFTRDKYSHI